jgi:uncharacterized protein (TIGR01777 family)
MRIVIAGGSGFLGRALSAALLEAGHDVVVLGRRASPRAGSLGPGVTYAAWTPDGREGDWAASCAGAEAIVNLAGESLAARRWSESQKTVLLRSRIDSAESLVALISTMTPAPASFISSSAIGFYGDRGDEILTEDSPAGTGFLAELVRQWEQVAARAVDLTRVVVVRSGLVLDPREGALSSMLLPFKLGLGGPFGSGKQYVSWIHRDDWVALVRWLIETPAVSGPVNATAPNPVPGAEFARTLGKALHRPAFMPAPSFALRLMLGEMADPLILTGQRVVPARATQAGFRFAFEDLGAALTDLLGR